MRLYFANWNTQNIYKIVNKKWYLVEFEVSEYFIPEISKKKLKWCSITRRGLKHILFKASTIIASSLDHGKF